MKIKITSLTLTFLLGIFSWSAMAQTEVTVAGSASGNGNYATLGAAIAAIPLTGQTGNNISVAINASTTELSTGITIGSGNWSSLKIYPTATATISAAANTSTTAFISLLGANNVTIDGRINRAGSTRSLTLNNSSTSATAASTILFTSDAQNDSIKYCTLQGRQQSGAGIITFSGTTSVVNGNGLNVIDNNLFTNNGGTNIYGVFAIGNTAYPNKSNKISNNEFKDILNWSLSSAVIYIQGGLTAGGVPQNDNFTISGNSIYNTTNIGTSNNSSRNGIIIGSSTNTIGGSHTVSDNYIGGSSANCNGRMTKSGSNNAFNGIQIYASGGTTSIQNNTIKNITWANNTNSAWTAISVQGTGNVNIGTVTGNTIGDNTSTGSIIVSNKTTASTTSGIVIATTGTANCQNNKIGSINAYNETTAIAAPINVIQKTATAGNVTISNNFIGSTTVANSIYAYNTSTPAVAAIGQNINGITCQGTGTNTISNNIIANLTNFTTIGYIYGINMNGTGSTGTIEGNSIHSNSITGYTGTGALIGISNNAGTNTIKNNIIKLGDNNACEIRGIADGSTATSTSSYHNTIYIGGSPTTGAFPSYCEFSSGPATIKYYKNNIFVNARSNNGASGSHYALYLNSTNTGTLGVDGNDYYVSGAGGILGRYSTDKTTLLDFKNATGQDEFSVNVNPSFTNAGGTLATDYITSNSSLVGVTGTGVTTDYAGTNRTAATMGAYFIPTIVSVPSGPVVYSNDLTLSGASQIEIAAGAELTLNSVLPTISKIILAPTAKLTMGSNTITAPNGVVLQSDATGTATLTGDNAVSNATVQQYVTSGRNWYMSAPVSAADYSWLNRGTSVVEWNEANKAWDTKVSGTLTPGKGYIQVATSTPEVTGTTGTVNVTGTTNSGDVAITVSRTESGSSRGFNLVGNPYPSYLKWTGENGFLAETTNDSISTSFWLRTKNTLGDYVFTTYNGSSHEVVGGTNATTLLNEYIPPMQAFWIRVNANTAVSSHNVGLTFKNNIRFHGVGDNNKFKAPMQNDRMRLRLQVSNGYNSDESLLYFDANAQNSFDNYDSPKMFNNVATKPEIFTNAGTEKLVINGMNEIPYNTEIPVGFMVGEAGNFTLSTVELSNFESGTRILLKDKLNPTTEFELAEGQSYNFSSQPTTASTDRFSLLFRAPGVATGIDNAGKINAQVFVNAANQITIIAPLKSNYAIYNAMGQLMENGFLNTERETRNAKLAAGVYVVKVGNVSTRVVVK